MIEKRREIQKILRKAKAKKQSYELRLKSIQDGFDCSDMPGITNEKQLQNELVKLIDIIDENEKILKGLWIEEDL